MKILFEINLLSDVNGQILYVENIMLSGQNRDAIYFWTSKNIPENETLGARSAAYCLDANTGQELWKTILPNCSGATTNSPAIDLEAGIMYFVTRAPSKELFKINSLVALNIYTGAHMHGSPKVIDGTLPGTGDGSKNGFITFSQLVENCRPGMLILITVYTFRSLRILMFHRTMDGFSSIVMIPMEMDYFKTNSGALLPMEMTVEFGNLEEDLLVMGPISISHLEMETSIQQLATTECLF